MTKTHARRALVLVTMATAMGVMGTATPAGAAVGARVNTYERFDFVQGPGGGLLLDWGYTPREVTVPQGSKIKWTNTSTDGEPHTVTVVDAGNVPQTIDEVFGCFDPAEVCGRAGAAHDPDGNQEPPFIKQVEVGSAGFNREGDSRLLLPGESAFPRITAPAGTTLHYLCAIHPWMQATVEVR